MLYTAQLMHVFVHDVRLPLGAKKGTLKPGLLAEPRPRGEQNSTWPSAPLRERRPSPASVSPDLQGSGLVVFGEAENLTRLRHSNCFNVYVGSPVFFKTRLSISLANFAIIVDRATKPFFKIDLRLVT